MEPCQLSGTKQKRYRESFPESSLIQKVRDYVLMQNERSHI
jgi:hypothetical protein